MSKPRTKIYRVRSGDTLSDIAYRYTRDWQAIDVLFALNPHLRERPNTIHPGETIIIPASWVSYGDGNMAMSKDRVEFTLTDYDKQRTALINAAVKAFGMTPTEARQCVSQEARIRCRPSQFARFLIYRSQEVEINRFSCLEAVLIDEKPPLLLDVSDRPRER